MKRSISFALAALFAGFAFSSCAKDPDEKKVVGPTSDTSPRPWNIPIDGQGRGSFGMLPQNQYRR